MTNEQQQVKEMMVAFNQECPEKPTIPSLEVRKLRAKLIIEEAFETVIALGIEPRIRIYTRANTEYGFDIQLNEHPFGPNLKEILDGCEDLKVVTEGTLLACGLCLPNPKQISVGVITPGLPAHISYEVERKEDPYFNEVMRSNMSKMWTDAEVAKITGEGEAFDPTGIIATNTYCDENGTTYKNVGINKWIVKDKDGKFIKSPSYSPPNFNL